MASSDSKAESGGEYTGLPSASNIIGVTALFALRGLIGEGAFAGAFYTLIVLLAVLNLGRFRSPKLVGGWYYVVATYVVGMTLLFIRDH